MEFSHTYDYLEPGKYFDTVWVALPLESKHYLSQLLSPIKGFCEWVTAVEYSTHAQNIPHITLRYTGYDSDELRKKMEDDKHEFEAAIREIVPVILELGNIAIWKSKEDNPNQTARLNWQIKNKDSLIKVHQQLLHVPDYAFFKSLEGDNYNPHISLAKVDLSQPNALSFVEEYLAKLPKTTTTYSLTDFGLSFASPNEGKNYRVSLGNKK